MDDAEALADASFPPRESQLRTLADSPSRMRARAWELEQTGAGLLRAFHPASCAPLADLFEHRLPVEEFAAISFFDPLPQLSLQFREGGFPGLLAFLEQPQAFANDLARGLIRPEATRDCTNCSSSGVSDTFRLARTGITPSIPWNKACVNL